MITDEKRREVAKKMREYDISEFKESAIVPFLECLGYGYTNWRGVLDGLAALIDRPTCTVSMGVTGHVGVCMRCGAMIETRAAVFNAIEALPTRYCPNCGAKLAGEPASRAVTQQR